MAANCNNSNSSSQYPSVCCVHNTESQPLLGYHNAHHASGSSQYQYQSPPPEYHVDMTANNRKGDHCTSSHGFVQQQCNCQQHYHHHRHRHHSDNQSDCSRSSSREESYRGVIVAVIAFFAFIYFISSMNSPPSRPSGPWNVASGSTAANINDLDLLSNGSNNLNFDRCRDNAIDWDGPSTFTTEFKNFRLKIGQGNIFSRVNISTGPVAFPTLHILGEVSPFEDGVKNNKPAAAHGGKIDIDYLGLHVEIVEEDNQLDAHVWYDNREVIDPRDQQHYRACARLFFEVILPESFTSYGSITIDGPVVVINAQDLENVKFDRLHFGSSVGEISTRGRIQSDVFDAKSNTGRVRAETIQVATAGKPLDVQVASITGGVRLTAETTDVDASEENPHKVHISTNTGRIELTVHPSTKSSTIDAKHGNLDISTTAVTGSIDTTIVLASQDQILTLTSKTNTGSIRNHVSDAFLGHFGLSTKWGSTRVEPAKDSKSTVTYEKLNAREKIGTKTLEGVGSVAGSIEIGTVTGSASLEFTK